MGFISEWRELIGNFISGALAGACYVTASQPFE